MEYISMKDVSFYYDKEPVIDNLSLSISSGQFISLTGENGTAKTTLVKVMIGILKEKSGKTTISKTNTKNEELKISYLPQQVSSFNIGFPSTVFEFVSSGVYRKNSWFKKFTKTDYELVKRSLEAVDMWSKKDEKIGYLSGGQKQRIIIARMLTSKSDILILDEPTTGMDQKTRDSFYKLLEKKVKSEGITIIMITHDNNDVAKYADKNIHLSKTKNNSWHCHFYDKEEHKSC